jgi:hypothetical protein
MPLTTIKVRIMQTRAWRLAVLGAMLMAVSVSASVIQAAEPIDLTGIWKLQPATLRAVLTTSDGKSPPLLPGPAALYAKNRAAYEAGDRTFDRANTICLSPGMPRMLLLPFAFQIIQRPHQLAFIFGWNNRYRLVDMRGTPPVIDDLSYMGTAAGKVEAEQILIDTQAMVDTTFLDASGMPHSDELRLTERYRLQDGGRTLRVELTINDPKTFAQPWSTTATFRRQPAGTRVAEDVCRARVYEGRPAFDLGTTR